MTCGDGNESLTGMTWTSWGGSVATATATYVVNSCEPNCAQGTPISYPVRVVANQVAHRASGQIYTNVTVTFIAQRPDGASASEDFPMAG